MTDRAESRRDFRGIALAFGFTCLLAGVAFLIFWGLAGDLYEMLSTSVRAVSGGRQLALADSGEAFMLYTRIAAAAAIVVSSPCVVGLWLHFAGGRTAADAVRATILAVILCVLGVAFGWFVGFPLMARSRAAVGSAEAQLAMEVFRLFLIMVASMALAFQIPAISYGLSQHPPDMDPTPAGGEEEAAGNPKA